MKKNKQIKPELFAAPKFKKRRFLKALITVSFFAGFNLVYNKITYKEPLPHKDQQQLPDHKQDNEKNNLLEELELQIAMDAYQNLLSTLQRKSQRLGVNLTDQHVIKIVSYDNMTDTFEVVLQNKNQTAVLKFSANEIKNIELSDDPLTLSNQVSKIAILLNSHLLDVPYVDTFENSLNTTLNNYVVSGINFYANSNTQFSDGNDRNELMDDMLLAGRDYYYFNVYGKGFKDGAQYDVVTIVSMAKDNYDILEIDNLKNFYLENPEDSRFDINVFYQESQNVLTILNQEKNKNIDFEK